MGRRRGGPRVPGPLSRAPDSALETRPHLVALRPQRGVGHLQRRIAAAQVYPVGLRHCVSGYVEEWKAAVRLAVVLRRNCQWTMLVCQLLQTSRLAPIPLTRRLGPEAIQALVGKRGQLVVGAQVQLLWGAAAGGWVAPWPAARACTYALRMQPEVIRLLGLAPWAIRCCNGRPPGASCAASACF